MNSAKATVANESFRNICASWAHLMDLSSRQKLPSLKPGRARGGIGRRARLRIWFRKEWRFKSSRAHHLFSSFIRPAWRFLAHT